MPSYLELQRTGELVQRAAQLKEILKECTLCPRECRVDRTAGELGVCGADAIAEVSSFNAHHGEEPPISGTRGSGTIFLTHCNLKCIFCQNYPISHLGNGNPAPPQRMARMMLDLQKRGCHNINFVTPTHYAPQIVEALVIAADGGLNIPIVYNCGGYESLHVLKLLEEIVDIYMPDMKYGSGPGPRSYSSCPDYAHHNRIAVKEMFRQTGSLKMDDEDIAYRGTMVRHLVLPDGLADSREVLEFIANELTPDLFVSVMEQYFPAYRANDDAVINRRITAEEYQYVVDLVDELGFSNGWIQDSPFY